MKPPGRYSGMTVSERLYQTGLLESFDAAAKARDRYAMIRILTELEVSDADASTDAILANPPR